MLPEVTVEAPTTHLTASQVRSLLADVERKEQAAKTLTVKDVQPGQYFKYTRHSSCTGCVDEVRLRLRNADYSSPRFAHPDGQVDEGMANAQVILVRNFDGEAL